MGVTEVVARKRVPAWRIWASIAASLLLVLLGLFVWMGLLGGKKWTLMEARCREMLAETRGRTTSRPALRGETVPGTAWDEYEPATKEADKLKGPKNTELADFVSRKPKADRAKVEAIVADHLSALESLRRGAARTEGRYPYRWEEGFSQPIPGLLQCQILSNLAVARARLLAEEGKVREAAELLLDTCQFGRDVGFNGVLITEMIGIAVYGLPLEELRDLILSGKLSREDMVEVGRELELLDRSFPRNGYSMVNEAMSAGFGFMKSEGLGVDEVTGGGVVWRFMPTRLLMADAFETMRVLMKRCENSDDLPWSEAERIGREIQEEAEHAKNPISKIMIPGLTSAHRAGRERRAQLRLLRVAAHYRATGEVLELDDPFGKKLLTSKTGDRLKIWSLGRNGADNGGTGDWKPTGADIVLETDR